MKSRQSLTENLAQQNCGIGSRLQHVVDELTQHSEFALARIWLINDGDICQSCVLRDQCVDQRACLHLVASAGRSRGSKQPQSWDRLDGSFRRLPLNVQKIGRIGATGEPLVISKVGSDGSALMHQKWVAEEHIRGFFGYPLQAGSEICGVLAVFSRIPLNESVLALLKTIAITAAELIAQAAVQSQLRLENQLLSLQSASASLPLTVPGRSAAARKLEAQIQLAAQYQGPVLITGKPGTGSREVARRIRLAGPQCSGLMIPVDGKQFCEQLLEVGSGFINRLPAGTVLLENMERVPLEQQRVLANALISMEDNSLLHRGRTKILASVTSSYDAGNVREQLQHDLHCLLSVLSVEIPPLSQRRDDLPELSNRIVNELQQRHGRSGLMLADDEIQRMQEYPWPGNDRELELTLERAVLRLPATETVLRNVLGTMHFGFPDEPQGTIASEEQMKEWQRENLIACLEECHWKVYGKDGAAARAGIKPTTFISRMKKFEIVRRQSKNK